MNIRPTTPADQALRELPEGMLEYECRCAIRNLCRLLGFDDARMLVAMYLNSEADRRNERR